MRQLFHKGNTLNITTLTVRAYLLQHNNCLLDRLSATFLSFEFFLGDGVMVMTILLLYSHGERKCLIEGRRQSQLKLDRSRSPSPRTVKTHAVHLGAANRGTLSAEMPKPRRPPSTNLRKSFSPTSSPLDGSQ